MTYDSDLSPAIAGMKFAFIVLMWGKVIKMKYNNKIILLLSIPIILIVVSFSTVAASLDFGWGVPIMFPAKSKQSEIKKNYMAWPVQISNYSKRRLVPLLDIVAVTDTGKQYSPVRNKLVRDLESDEMVNISDIEDKIFPDVTRRSIILFSDIDPKANIIHFYVGGLREADLITTKDIKYLKITYKRSPAGWKWESINFLE